MLLIQAILYILSTCVVISSAITHEDKLREEVIRHGQLLWSDSLHNTTHPEVELLRRYETVGDEMELAISDRGSFSTDTLPLNDFWILDRIRADLRSVNEMYKTFRSFQILQKNSGKLFIPKHTWTDLADTILSNSTSSIPNALQKIRNLIIEERLFHQVLQVIVQNNCYYSQSPAQLLYDLYTEVAWTQLKGHFLIQFSWQIYELFDKEGNYSSEVILLRREYQHNALITTKVAKSTIKIASRQLWKCDPKTHDKDKTYTELNRLLQGYIVNEEDLSGTENCKKSCDAYQYTAKHKCSVGKYDCEDPVCDGAVYNCQFIESDMSICPGKTDSRRYTYINYKKGRKLGKDQTCNTSERKVDSRWKYLLVHCSYCMCICADLQHSDRYFNLREYSADTENNRVVTGLKFVKVNRVIHLQIQEGQLLPYGKINQTTIRWQQVDNYKVNDGNPNKQYHTLSWKERGIDLDDVVLPEERVVTGVRFRLAGANLKLEILASPINFTSGTIMNASRSTWHSNFDPANKRSELKLDNKDVPTKASNPSKIISTSGQYLQFTHTGIDADVAQSTVPFIDVQPVVSNIPVPLGGVGVYYKGQEGYGGFLAPKIITYDYSKYIAVQPTAMSDP